MKFTKTNAIILFIIIAGASISGLGIGLWFIFNMQSNNALANADVSVDSAEVSGVNNDTMEVKISGTITNPSGINAILHPMSFTIKYLNLELGTGQITEISITGVTTHFNQTVNITVKNNNNFNMFVNDFITNATVKVELTGNAFITALGFSITKPVSKTISLNGMNNQLNFTIVSFSILNASSTKFRANITTEIENPSTLKLNLNDVHFNISWQNEILGELIIPQLSIQEGIKNITIIGIVSLVNSTRFDNMVDQLLNNTDILLNITGIPSKNNILSYYISKLNLSVLMPGLEAFDCVILAINLTDCSNDSFDLDVMLEIYNPTSGSVNISNIYFNTSYNGEQLGTVSFPNLTVYSGTEKYLVNVTFTLTNATLLSDILTNYLSGTEINITFIGVANGSNVISNMVDGYKKNITLPASPPFNYGINSISLINSTAKTLTLNATLMVNNPTPLSVSLNATLNTTYKTEWIGNLTAKSINLISGNNNIHVQIIISGEKNISAVEDLLSQHINGNIVELILNGSINIKVDGMKSTVNTSYNSIVNLTGIHDDLITQVRLNFIELKVDWSSYPSISYAMNAYVNATIYNPFNFSINITYLEYSIYFDDPDGCLIQAYIPFVGTVTIANYPSKYHVNIDNITKNYTANPPPIKLNNVSYKNISETISSSNDELCSRLYDDYYQDNDLTIDITHGKMQVKIGDFKVWISFEFLDVPVPQT